VLVLQISRLHGQQLSGFNLGSHIGQFKGYSLKIGNRLPKLFSFFGIFHTIAS
jgi:hypothetical protein